MRITTNGSLGIQLEGPQVLWALRRRVVVERAQVTAMRFHPEYTDPGRAWRAGGTGLPGGLFAGNFRRDKKWEFWYIKRPRGFLKASARNVLEVEAAGHHFARLLVTVHPGEAGRLIAWFEATTLSQAQPDNAATDVARERSSPSPAASGEGARG